MLVFNFQASITEFFSCRKTGVNIKDLTGNSITAVMSAPRDIANMMKRNMFGSADNLPGAVENAENNGTVGRSKFYTSTPTSRPTTERARAMTTNNDQQRSDTNEGQLQSARGGVNQSADQRTSNRLSGIDLEHISKVVEESEQIRKRCVSLEDKNKELNAEIGMLRSELTAARYHTQVSCS